MLLNMGGVLQEDVIRHLQLQGADSELVRTLYLQEVNRVKYMLRAYLRCRLLKIEKYVMHVLDNEEEQEKLSPQELHHAQVPPVEPLRCSVNHQHRKSTLKVCRK